MESAGALLLVLMAGGALFALDRQRKRARDRVVGRGQKSPTPRPSIPRPPGPADSAPAPAPDVELEEDREEVPDDRWQEICWWTMTSKADAYLEIGTTYYATWPLEWNGDEEYLVVMDPEGLADVVIEEFEEDGELYLDLTLIPKKIGWGTLMATEGTPGAGAVYGKTPWRSQCMKIEVI